MHFHRCEICREDGSVVGQDVQVGLEEVREEPAPRWHGTITMAHLTALTAGQKYRLTLDDGRSATFVVRRNTSAGGDDRAVAIHGVSPLK